MKSIKKLLLIVAAGLITVPVRAQQRPGADKAQMYADFDTLTANLAATSPHLQLKKALWHYDAMERIKALRKGIDTVSCADGFALLVNRVLNTCQDYHTSLLSLPGCYNRANDAFKLWLPVDYINGRYVLARSFTQGGVVIAAGSIITEAENEPIDKYIAGLTGYSVLRYDVERHKFYSETFFRNQQTLFSGKIDLVFKTPPGKIVSLRLSTLERANFVNPIHDTLRNQVSYWDEQQTLYIKVVVMDPAILPRLMKKLADFRKAPKPLQRIIIDLRDNGGGADTVWQTLYQSILPAPATYPLVLDGLSPQQLNADYLKQEEIDPVKIKPDDNPLVKKFGFYKFYNHDWKITPNDSSLRFNGKIIILGNENNYSSGASAFQLAQADTHGQVHLISRSTGMFLGTGYAPVVLKLPNSKLEYRIEPAIEVSGGKQLVGLMHDHYEITIPCTIQELLDKANYNGNTFGKTFMLSKDPFVLKALSL